MAVLRCAKTSCGKIRRRLFDFLMEMHYISESPAGKGEAFGGYPLRFGRLGNLVAVINWEIAQMHPTFKATATHWGGGHEKY